MLALEGAAQAQAGPPLAILYFCSSALLYLFTVICQKPTEHIARALLAHNQKNTMYLGIGRRIRSATKRGEAERRWGTRRASIISPCLTSLTWVLCYPQPQVGHLVAASELLQFQKKQEHPGRLIPPMSRYVSRQNLCCVQVVMESSGPALASFSPYLLPNLICLEKEGSARLQIPTDLTWTLNTLLRIGHQSPTG